MMGTTDAEGMVRHLRFMAAKFRELQTFVVAGNIEQWKSRWSGLASKLSRVLEKLYSTKRMPSQIEIAIRDEIAEFSEDELFWYFHSLGHRAIGYHEVVGVRIEGSRKGYCTLRPGLIYIVWPEIFRELYVDDEMVGFDPELLNRYVANESKTPVKVLRKILEINHKAVVEHGFDILSYYATACDLLAEWIEAHADDDRDDRIAPGDGLQCDDTIFVWGGKTYAITGITIAPVLKVLMRAYRQGRDATTDEFELALGNEIKNGFGSLFRMGKHPNKKIHPVRSVILPPHGKGRANYRLIDPVKPK